MKWACWYMARNLDSKCSLPARRPGDLAVDEAQTGWRRPTLLLPDWRPQGQGPSLVCLYSSVCYYSFLIRYLGL